MKRLPLCLLLLASACGGARVKLPAGLPRALAERRAADIGDVRYDLRLHIDERVGGIMTVRFNYRGDDGEAVLDFQAPPENLLAVDRPYRVGNGHVAVQVRRGPNTVTLRFTSPETALHRGDDYLYSLFVPERAKEAVPLFDQPDIKARWKLTLDLPAGWRAVANGAPERVYASSVAFRETPPIPSYLFAFAAGKFQVRKGEAGRRVFRIYHLKKDSAKFARAAPRIFELHAEALAWLEDYTQVRYPWGKFDIVLLPSFPYRGMEHPGAVFYRADALLLDEAPTQEDRLARADTIAHECAHQWFGNLVTMRWFDDVWTKESFASFFAAKITGPMFPQLDHALRFVVAHAHAAYTVDRSRGAHALWQSLPNLDEAGTLYGNLIYHKSPFVLRQLEAVMGEDAFRRGLRAYFKAHAFGNASWRELVAILDRETPQDLARFSKMWVETAGRPTVRAAFAERREEISALTLTQEGGVWPQRLSLFIPPRTFIPVLLDRERVEVPAAVGKLSGGFILANGGGMGYGRFLLDDASAAHALPTPKHVEPPLARGALWETLYERVLDGGDPLRFVEDAIEALPLENNELVLTSLLGRRGKLQTVYWRLLSAQERRLAAPKLEHALWRRIAAKATPPSLKKLLFKAYVALALSEQAVQGLADVARRPHVFAAASGISLSERDRAALTLTLSLHGHVDESGAYRVTFDGLKDPEERARLAFLHRAASPDAGVRRALVRDLYDVRHRRKEPWVEDALRLLHHPLRAAGALEFVRPQLNILPEVQRTGDIFFPAMWANGILSGHSSPQAAAIVEAYLRETPALAQKLRLKVLQAADVLERAAKRPAAQSD